MKEMEEEAQQVMSAIEEEELVKLMINCEFAINNADALVEVLKRDLCILDGQNVQSVLAKELQVDSLMQQINLSIAEAEKAEKRLDNYAEVVSLMRDAMDGVEEKNNRIKLANVNSHLLLGELEKIIKQLELSPNCASTLLEPEFGTEAGLNKAVQAAYALKSMMEMSMDPFIFKLQAIQEQIKKNEKVKDAFVKSLFRELKNIFCHIVNDPVLNINETSFPKYESLHQKLVPYSPLIHWLRVVDNSSYNNLKTIYTNSMGNVYDRNIKTFFNNAKETLDRYDLRQEAVKSKNVKPVTGILIGVEKEQWALDVTYNDRQRYENMLEQVLKQLEQVCFSEQFFSVSFFQLDISISENAENVETHKNKNTKKKINHEVRTMMSNLFSCLEGELNSFISYLEKHDQFCCMYGLVRLSQHVLLVEDRGSFLSMAFANALVNIKRSFDRFMQRQLDSVNESKVPRRHKCGILHYVANFEEFARSAEVIFGTERRADLDKWYVRLVDAITAGIPKHATEHPRTPADVIKMENYHHLFALLSQLKIPSLDNHKKEAKVLYNDALSAYVTNNFGRPLEKLNQFFEGVEAKVASGVKLSEIGFHMAFSKQELRKVISQYTSREVKKGLELLYKKVEKHLCEEENLLQVVWRAMQEEFVKQYKYLEQLIQKCYPGSKITLEFTIDDVLNFFSSIARSH